MFLGAFNGFLAIEPRLGCREVDFQFLSGYWKPEIHFSTPEKISPVRKSALPTFFTSRTPPACSNATAYYTVQVGLLCNTTHNTAENPRADVGSGRTQVESPGELNNTQTRTVLHMTDPGQK